MHYTTITAGELRKMDGVKVKAQTNGGMLIEGEIIVEGGETFILHNNPKANGNKPDNMRGYEYSRIIFEIEQEDTASIRRIKRLETIEEFTEGELVYVSDVSVEDAFKKDLECVFLYTTSKGIHTVQDKKEYDDKSSNCVSGRKYIAKIPKEETVEMTMEEVCKALGKKVKIIE